MSMSRKAWLMAVALAVTMPLTVGAQQGSTVPTGTTKQQAAKASFSAAEIEEIQTRAALAKQIVANIAASASTRGLAETWQMSTMNNLLAIRSANLKKLSTTGSYDAVIAAIGQNAKQARAKVLGDIANDLTYTPVTPCRLIDTRNVGGKISPSRGYDLDVAGNPYGGDPGCNIETLIGVDEDQMGGFFLNVTIVDPNTAPGFVAVRPSGTSQVTSLVNWYESGPTVQIANAGIITGANSGNGLGGQANSFDIVTSTGVHVIVDFFGAFVRPEATALSCTNVLNASSSTVDPGSFVQFTDAGIAACGTGFTAVGFVWDFVSGSGGLAPWENAPGNPGIALGFFHTAVSSSNPGSTITFTPGRRCCRVPGR